MHTLNSMQAEIPKSYGGDSHIPEGEWDLEKLIRSNLPEGSIKDTSSMSL